jgi:Protein of unknown function (DUF3604)
MRKQLALFCVMLAMSSAGMSDPQTYSNIIAVYPDKVLWGDTHLHTKVSVDANAMGNLGLSVEDAYRFASGQTVTATNGMKAKLDAPLDFLVVSDHAEYLGFMSSLRAGDKSAWESQDGKLWAERVSSGGEDSNRAIGQIMTNFLGGKAVVENPKLRARTWNETLEAAERSNRPGVFSALTGFEWSSSPNDNNLHRVVVFKDGIDRTGKTIPFSNKDSEDPRALWRYLEQYEQDTGGAVLAIPHNGNISNGLMFAETQYDGTAMDKEYAMERMRWEPIVEVTQIKGDAETHPYLSPDDEFADYGTWDSGNFNSIAQKQVHIESATGSEADNVKKPEMLQYEYARSALRVGLQIEQKTGANPYQFGMIGSTDSHTSLATAEEDNYWGKAPPFEPGIRNRTEGTFLNYAEHPGKSIMSWQQLASGYAAVWATENTREAIFEAMKRREVYATTGPRMTVRFFAGWDYEEVDIHRPNFEQIGYARGVPMGGVLAKPVSGRQAPKFLISATREPNGANLDRVQVIKGWVDNAGASHEQVYDVVWSGDRKLNKKGKLPAVGNTVDKERATYLNTIGASQLAAYWQDPDFDPDENAFYYVRVLEIPTPTWVLHDKVKLGSQFTDKAPLIHQERAYTSPIWYRPWR